MSQEPLDQENVDAVEPVEGTEASLGVPADLNDAETAEATTDEAGEDADIEDADIEDPAEEFKRTLRAQLGDWYVIHSYAGYENRVKANLENRIQSLNMEDYIFQIEVPMEEVTEIKNAQKKTVPVSYTHLTLPTNREV